MKSTERFKELAKQAAPLQRQVAEISYEMAKLAQQASVEIVTKAFPKAEVMTIKAVSEIKPSDFCASAEEAVAILTELGHTPDLIIIDDSRMTVTLAIKTK